MIDDDNGMEVIFGVKPPISSYFVNSRILYIAL